MVFAVNNHHDSLFFLNQKPKWKIIFMWFLFIILNFSTLSYLIFISLVFCDFDEEEKQKQIISFVSNKYKNDASNGH